jgi:hypothetical protein
MSRRLILELLILIAGLLLAPATTPAGEDLRVPPESAEAAKVRHARVAQRRQRVHIICHRGASQFAHENTLEAYRATFELGGDGNEIDIRKTKDDVLVCFHDDMLDRILDAYGDVSEVPWAELRRFRFREPGRFGRHCRIPTLVEVFELHRRHAGLLHLDIKRPGLDKAIANLLTRMDMWDHVAYCNMEHGGVILRHARLKLRRYKGALYQDHSEMEAQAIAALLKKPGDGVIVDDPRGVSVALGRKLGKMSDRAVAPLAHPPGPMISAVPAERQLIKILRNASDWDHVAQSPEERTASGERIRARARAAEGLLARKTSNKEAWIALAERVRKRSLHKDWMYHGLDGAMALRTLIHLRAPGASDLARWTLWRDDPGLKPVVNPQYKVPRSWTDFRVKMVIFPALEHCPGPETVKLCRDYLALSEAEARRIGPLQFDQAGRTLLRISPRTEIALELMKHRLRVVRGQAILECLAHAREPWAQTALRKGAPHALAYVVPNIKGSTK